MATTAADPSSLWATPPPSIGNTNVVQGKVAEWSVIDKYGGNGGSVGGNVLQNDGTLRDNGGIVANLVVANLGKDNAEDEKCVHSLRLALFALRAEFDQLRAEFDRFAAHTATTMASMATVEKQRAN